MNIFGFEIGKADKTPEERTYNLIKIKLDNIIIHVSSLKDKINSSTKNKHIGEFNEELKKFYTNLDSFERIFIGRKLTNGINTLQHFTKKNTINKVLLNSNTKQQSLNQLKKLFSQFKENIIKAEKEDLEVKNIMALKAANDDNFEQEKR
jgi:hypothetical protein